MKNLLHKILIVFLLSAQSLLAYPPPQFGNNYASSTLEIKFQGSGFITVAINGDYYQEPVKHFSLNNIPGGDHYIEVFIEKINHSGYYSNTQTIKAFAGNVKIEPGSLVKAVVDNAGRFFIKQVEQMTYYENPVHPYYEPYYQPYHEYHAPVYFQPVAIDNIAFEQLLHAIKGQWFDDSKLSVANQALALNWFTAAQIATIMHTISFEDNRLELAKSAYPKVIDKQNYFIVNNEFWFNSSVEELSYFVINYR